MPASGASTRRFGEPVAAERPGVGERGHGVETVAPGHAPAASQVRHGAPAARSSCRQVTRITRQPAAWSEPVALAVALEGRGRGVGGAAVELHDEPLRRPGAVHLAAAPTCAFVRGRGRPWRSSRRRKRSSSSLRVRVAPASRAASAARDRGRARAARVAGEEVAQRERVGEAEHVRLVDGPLELAAVEDGGEVEERARHGRDRDAVEDGALVGREGGAVEPDACAAASLPRDGHVDRARAVSREAATGRPPRGGSAPRRGRRPAPRPSSGPRA